MQPKRSPHAASTLAFLSFLLIWLPTGVIHPFGLQVVLTVGFLGCWIVAGRELYPNGRGGTPVGPTE